MSQNKQVVFRANGSYVPICPEFLRTSYEVSGPVKNILITIRSGDCDNIAEEVCGFIIDASKCI